MTDVDPGLNPADIEHNHGNHELCDPDVCMTAKLRYMREHGVNVHVPNSFKAVRS